MSEQIVEAARNVFNLNMYLSTANFAIPYLPVYNVHYFLTNFASKIEMS